MASATADASIPGQRPQHKRNKSSRSGILKSLVSTKSRPLEPETTQSPSHTQQSSSRTQKVPLLPPDHPHALRSKVLGERQSNVQSPPSSPSKRRDATATSRRDGGESTRPGMAEPKKSKSSTSLSAMFGKMNRSSKDLSTYAAPAQSRPGDKENTTPPSSANGPMQTPIWAQYASSNAKPSSRPVSRDSKSTSDIRDEIAKYTPVDYSPSKQRNFNDPRVQPSLRPAAKPRPQSTYGQNTESFVEAIGRRVSGARASLEIRRSEDGGRRLSKDNQRISIDKPALKRASTDRTERKVSGSSTEQAAPKEKLNITKRGGRVMAAVAAWQGKGKNPAVKKEADLDPEDVDKAFEAVLDSRQIPEPMRQKMRSLTLRVKADFIRQNDEASKTTTSSPPDSREGAVAVEEQPQQKDDEDSKSTKRSRPRSRTFTFTKGDKRAGDASPSKKNRSQSKSRPVSIHVPKDQANGNASTPTTPTNSSFGKRGQTAANPSDYISYLKKNQEPKKLEVGRLHKLRILLRNETVAWVDSFIGQGGMAEVVGLLHRIMAIEWREEHEDQLLHEGLLCLKGLCTTERAMAELEKVADELFPALLGMVFDDEKRGPAEYTTRTIIVNILFNYLSASLNASATALEHRARQILTYLSSPVKPTTSDDSKPNTQPIDFVLGMHVPRPYKLWCREVTNVTKEVFWIFLHHLNVVPLPKRPGSAGSDTTSPAPGMVDVAEEEERAKVLEATYTHRHFPGLRAPVPAAPYIGGVEWDATTYITSHLDLLNGLIASLPTSSSRNQLRQDLQASGFEKTLGGTLRTCKEKFYSGVHDGLKVWVAAASEDGWETRFVREGPTTEERVKGLSPGKKSPVKKGDEAPRLEVPRLELDIGGKDCGKAGDDGNEDEGWLG